MLHIIAAALLVMLFIYVAWVIRDSSTMARRAQRRAVVISGVLATIIAMCWVFSAFAQDCVKAVEVGGVVVMQPGTIVDGVCRVKFD